MLLTNVTVGKVPFTETGELGVKPVPFNVSVKPGPPATASDGLRLVRVRGVAMVLYWVVTKTSSVTVRSFGDEVPVRSYCHPAKSQPEFGVSVKVRTVPVG